MTWRSKGLHFNSPNRGNTLDIEVVSDYAQIYQDDATMWFDLVSRSIISILADLGINIISNGGNVYISSPTNVVLARDTTTKGLVISDNPPAPHDCLWIDTSGANSILKTYSGGAWVAV